LGWGIGGSSSHFFFFFLKKFNQRKIIKLIVLIYLSNKSYIPHFYYSPLGKKKINGKKKGKQKTYANDGRILLG
jgi:hypothetical protein